MKKLFYIILICIVVLPFVYTTAVMAESDPAEPFVLDGTGTDIPEEATPTPVPTTTPSLEASCTDADMDSILHKWDEGVVLTPATYSGEGQILYTCLFCKRTKTVIIPRKYYAGDINGDGTVNICDLIRLSLYLQDRNTTVYGSPDVDNNGVEDLQDLVYLMQYFSGEVNLG